jgi:hypothetical protein
MKSLYAVEILGLFGMLHTPVSLAPGGLTNLFIIALLAALRLFLSLPLLFGEIGCSEDAHSSSSCGMTALFGGGRLCSMSVGRESVQGHH